MGRQTNRRIAFGLIIVTVLLVIGFSGIIVALPDTAYATIDNVPVKYILVLVGNLVLLLIALSVFRFLYYPPPRRVILILFYSLLFFGMLHTGVYVGLSAQVSEQIFNIQAGSGSAELTAFIVALVYVVGAGWLAREYINLAIYESKRRRPLL